MLFSRLGGNFKSSNKILFDTSGYVCTLVFVDSYCMISGNFYSWFDAMYWFANSLWADIHTWSMPSLSRRSERRRHENILRKVLIQRNCEYRQCNCTTQELSFQWHRRSPGQRFVYSVEEIAHFSTANTWSSTRLFRWEGSRQHDRTPTKIAFALENFPATVIMPSTWPDWSKFQFLRSWHNPAEIRSTRTTTYQTWSERSNH